mgnify:FL=1
MFHTHTRLAAAQACSRARVCAQNCHKGYRVRKLSDLAITQYQKLGRARSLTILAAAGNQLNLNNNDARGQGGGDAVAGRQHSLLIRILEIMLSVIAPKEMIKPNRLIPPANVIGGDVVCLCVCFFVR